MYPQVQQFFAQPDLFSIYTAEKLWNDPHISKQMLALHLNETADPASRNQAFIERSLNWLNERFEIGAEIRIADFGCGPGLYTTPLAEMGAQVTGIDFSARSIAHARQRATEKKLSIDYRQQNYLEFSSEEKFDLITLIYCDFCALSPAQRQQLLRIFHQQLVDGGRLLLDVFSLASFKLRQESTNCGHLLMNGFWSAQDYYGFQRTFKYEADQVILDKYTIVEPKQSFEVYNWLQYYSRQSLIAELEQNGFQIMACYADVAGSEYSEDAAEIAVVATKH